MDFCKSFHYNSPQENKRARYTWIKNFSADPTNLPVLLLPLDMKCSQCSKQAIIQYDFGLLCVDCNLKYQQANDIVLNNLYNQTNFLMDEMDAMAGVRLGGGRYPIRKPPVIHGGDVNIKSTILNNSVVGNINQGTVNSLNANLQNITISYGNKTQEIKNFIETVAKDNNLTIEQKEEVAGKMDFLIQQLQSQQRNRSVIKTVVLAIGAIISVSADLVTLWQALHTIFLK